MSGEKKSPQVVAKHDIPAYQILKDSDIEVKPALAATGAYTATADVAGRFALQLIKASKSVTKTQVSSVQLPFGGWDKWEVIALPVSQASTLGVLLSQGRA